MNFRVANDVAEKLAVDVRENLLGPHTRCGGLVAKLFVVLCLLRRPQLLLLPDAARL